MSPLYQTIHGARFAVILQATWRVSQRAAAGPSRSAEMHAGVQLKALLLSRFPVHCSASTACVGSSWRAAAFPGGTIQCPDEERRSVQCHREAHGLREGSIEQQVEKDTKRTKSLSGRLFENRCPCELKM